jgi:hypothetical protein
MRLFSLLFVAVIVCFFSSCDERVTAPPDKQNPVADIANTKSSDVFDLDGFNER